MAALSHIHTVAELLKTLKTAGLQLQACSITPDGGISFQVLPETIASFVPGQLAGKDAATFDDIPTPFDDVPKDPKKADKWRKQMVREALGSEIPSSMGSDF